MNSESFASRRRKNRQSCLEEFCNSTHDEVDDDGAIASGANRGEMRPSKAGYPGTLGRVHACFGLVEDAITDHLCTQHSPLGIEQMGRCLIWGHV